MHPFDRNTYQSFELIFDARGQGLIDPMRKIHDHFLHSSQNPRLIVHFQIHIGRNRGVRLTNLCNNKLVYVMVGKIFAINGPTYYLSIQQIYEKEGTFSNAFFSIKMAAVRKNKSKNLFVEDRFYIHLVETACLYLYPFSRYS